MSAKATATKSTPRSQSTVFLEDDPELLKLAVLCDAPRAQDEALQKKLSDLKALLLRAYPFPKWLDSIESLKVFGVYRATSSVLIQGNISEIKRQPVLLNAIQTKWNESNKGIVGWTILGFVSDNVNLTTNGYPLYRDRLAKSENAAAFLKRVYADELAAGEITLSDLRQRDKTLWAGLRNWASAGKHDLDKLIPRGKTAPGPAREKLGFDLSTLNPADPVHAAALKLADAREAARQRAKKSRLRTLSR